MIDHEYKLSDRYLATEGRVFLSGVQALARIPIEQLLRDRARGRNTAGFVSGYPGSPLGGLDQELTRALALVSDLPIVHQPAVNEELAASSVMGSQLASTRSDALYDGVVGIWYGKAPGLDRATDALRHGVFAGSSTEGGVLALVGDDPAAKSSTMPSSSDAALVDLHMPILYPGTVEECLELGLHGIAMSRASGLWSSVKVVTPVADGNATLRLPVMPLEPMLPEHRLPDGSLWSPHPSAQFLGQRMVAVEQEFQDVRSTLARQYGRLNNLNRITANPGNAWLGIVATGYTYYQALECLKRLGLKDLAAVEAAGIRLLHLRMPVPFDRTQVKEFSKGLSEIFVVEEKNPTLERLIRDCLYDVVDRPRVTGKRDEQGATLLASHGHLNADTIEAGMRDRLGQRLSDILTPEAKPLRSLIPLAINRTPYFCSGCPHSWGTKVPEGAVVGMGTGCHGMTLLMDEERVGDSIGITAMGNEGSQWIGMAPFVRTDHVIQNLGDGTYFHSGQLAIQAAIGAGMSMTFKILYNDTVAMTGGQETSHRVNVADLAKLLLTHGVQEVVVTTDDTSRYDRTGLPKKVAVKDRTKLVQIQERLATTAGVTVIIHDQACAAEVRRGRRRGTVAKATNRIAINHRICEGCGDCGDVSNCLSVQPFDTPLGRKTTIDQESCNVDRSCLEGDCPAFYTVDVDVDVDAKVNESESGLQVTSSRNDAGASPTLAMVDVPPPNNQTPGTTALRLAGIGGTGVVTAAQLIATAALLDGLSVDGLDQTGLSQKAGPVISDLVIGHPERHRTTNHVGTAQADLLLCFDQLVGAADSAILAASPGHTTVIMSTSTTPTGAQVTNPGLTSPTADEVKRRFVSASDPSRYLAINSQGLATALCGSPATANVLLLGVALQQGCLPVTVESLEQAIRLNGVLVEQNLAALAWGRRWAHSRTEVEDLANLRRHPAPEIVTEDLPLPLREEIASFALDDERAALITMLASDLLSYQDAAYAQRFLALIKVATLVRPETPEERSRWIEGVGRGAHKLMAYKDEYEVARLLAGPAAPGVPADINATAVTPTMTWYLQPPTLRRFSSLRKLKVSARTAPAFRILANGKRLRGTRLDPFGRTTLRRLEQDLVTEFEDVVQALIRSLTSGHADSTSNQAALASACQTVELAQDVRGFEELKIKRIHVYQRLLGERMADI